MYLDRHAIAQLVAYSTGPREGEELAEQIEQWLTIRFDAATQEGRDLFATMVKAAASQWPWSAVEAAPVDWSEASDALASEVKRAPAALALLINQDTNSPELLDPANRLADGEAAGPLRAALVDWAPSVLAGAAEESGWAEVIVMVPTNDQEDASEEPEPGSEPEVEPAGDTTPPQPQNSDEGHPAALPPRAWWQRWEYWAAAGAATVAVVGASAYYRRQK